MFDVLFLLPYFDAGGGERFVSILCREMLNDGFQVTVAAITLRNPAMLSEMPVVVEVMNSEGEHRIRRDVYKIIRWLVKLLRVKRPKVVITLLNENLWILLLACRLSRVRPAIVANVHINISMSLRRLPKIRRLYLENLLKYSFRYVDRIIAVSHGVADDLVGRLGAPPEIVDVIPNPVDAEEIALKAKETVRHRFFETGDPVIIAVGRLIEQKGFNHLIMAFAKIVKQRKAYLCILGEGPLRRDLEDLATSLNCRQYIDFLGFQPNPYKYIRSADLFVLSSLWEASPYALVEAMLVGTPIVSTNCPSGPSELLDRGRYGILVPPGNHRELASAILGVFSRPSDARKKAEEAAKWARQWDKRVVVPKYMELVSRFCDR